MLLVHAAVLQNLIEQYDTLRVLHAENGSPQVRRRMDDMAYTLCVSTGTRDIDAARGVGSRVTASGLVRSHVDVSRIHRSARTSVTVVSGVRHVLISRILTRSRVEWCAMRIRRNRSWSSMGGGSRPSILFSGAPLACFLRSHGSRISEMVSVCVPRIGRLDDVRPDGGSLDRLHSRE